MTLDSTNIRMLVKSLGAALIALGVKGIAEGDVNQWADIVSALVGAALSAWGWWEGRKAERG